MKYAVLTGILSVAIVAGASFALASESAREAGHKGPHFKFEELDANQDGELSKDEMKAHRKAQFMKMDTDNDGQVSEAELRVGMSERAEKKMERRIGHMMDRHDANNDGKLSAEEFEPRKGGRMFDRIDSDGSGTISRAEFDAMKAKWEERKNKG